MRITFLVALLLTSSIMAAPDQGVRAFLGIRSAGMTLTKVNHGIIYVYALARLEKGRFIKFEQMSNGSLLAQRDATFELLWGKNNGQSGFAFVAGTASREFKADTTFEKFAFESRQAQGEYATTISMAPEYKGMKVLTGAFSQSPKDPMLLLNPSTKIEESLADVDCSLLVLFQECRTAKDSLDFLRGLKSSK